MTRFWCCLAAAAVLSIVAPLASIAQDDEVNSKEMELKACGPKEKEVNFKAGTDKSGHPTPDQPPDKALIYVLRPSMIGNKVQTKLAVDGDWKGVNRGNNYFYFTLDPGEHYFCSEAENRSLLKLNVEAGKTYYLQQHVRMGVMKARNKLEPMTEEEGKKKLAEAHPSTWETK
jgi:hypothetical protein